MTHPPIFIAYAQDHEIVREGVAEIFSRPSLNFQVIIKAENGRVLLEMLKESTICPDICILDIRMPVMDGYQTMLELKKKYPRIKVLILTSCTEDVRIQKMINAGAWGNLSLSVSPKTLIETIKEIYHGCYNPNPQNSKKNECFLPCLKQKEEEFLTFCSKPLTYKQIGSSMNLSERTVQHMAEKISEKAGIQNNRIALALYAITRGLGG